MKKENGIIYFLYRTSAGRLLLRILVKPSFSRKIAYYLNSRYSKWLIPYYIKKYQIDMSLCEKKEFDSFNDFFIRNKIIHVSQEKDVLISPCDGLLSIYKIDKDTSFSIKNSEYTVRSLLKNEMIAENFEEGLCLIFRLEPRHYHRYIFVQDGIVENQAKISGILHCVKPLACNAFPVYLQNSREYTLIKTKNMGTIIQMEVGAMLVGKINNHRCSTIVKKGQEKGYFEFGGSTIVVLLEKNVVSMDVEVMINLGTGKEIPVNIGEKIGKILNENRYNQECGAEIFVDTASDRSYI